MWWRVLFSAGVCAQEASLSKEVASHFKTRLREPSFTVLEEHGAGAPWFLGDGTIWQHTRMWLHSDVASMFGVAFNQQPVKSEHFTVTWSLNFTDVDHMLADSFVAFWLVDEASVKAAVGMQDDLFRRKTRGRDERFPFPAKEGEELPVKGLVVVVAREPEKAIVGVKVHAALDGAKQDWGPVFNGEDAPFTFNPGKQSQLHLAMAYSVDGQKKGANVYAQAGDGGNDWKALLDDAAREKVVLPGQPQLGFTSYSGTSKGTSACGAQVTKLDVHSYEKSGGEGAAYLEQLHGHSTEEELQAGLQGIVDDVKSEYAKHTAVIAETREQLQRLEKQVHTIATRIDSHEQAREGKTVDSSAEAHGLLHAFNTAKKAISDKTETAKIEMNKQAFNERKQAVGSKAVDKFVEGLDEVVEKSRWTWMTWFTCIFMFAVVVSAAGVVYKKMNTYEKKHHL